MKQIRTLLALLLAVVGLTSCMKSSDTEATLYNDAAITAFTLGTLNRYTTVTTADTTYTAKVSFTGSSYKFTIDQIATADNVDGLPVMARHIYNCDSLPVGTDAAHILCTITTRNNGTAGIYEPADSTFYYTNDSIDFSRPRLVRVYASDGSGYSDYVVNVNVHQEEGELFVWKQMEDYPLPVLDEMPTPDGIKQLLGGCTTESYALSTDNQLMVWNDSQARWMTDSLDSDPTLLPTDDCSLVSYPVNYANETDYVLLVGNREEKQADGSSTWTSSVWRKIVDYGKYGKPSPWAYVERAKDTPYQLPYLKGVTIIYYDDCVLAFGGDYSKIYQSRDNGITWKVNKRYKMPAGFDSSAMSVWVVKDDDDFIWLFCYGTGQVWRGRLNRLGWVN
jgi:hypothetical protein